MAQITHLRLPRESAVSREEVPSTGVVEAVARALQLLESFSVGEASLPLSELSRRCGMNKTTALRIARTLAMSGYLVQADSGEWRLGPAAGWLGARYRSGFDLHDVVEPTLRELTQASGETATFFVREGSHRVCIARVEGPRPMPQHIHLGEAIPLGKGSPGNVIMAFSGAAGPQYDRIRSLGYDVTIGARQKEVAAVAAPIFGLGWQMLGSVCVSGPVFRLSADYLHSIARLVVTAANRLSYSLAGDRMPEVRMASSWHP
jgi:DNA-binding IclR family transcriptional regulator